MSKSQQKRSAAQKKITLTADHVWVVNELLLFLYAKGNGSAYQKKFIADARKLFGLEDRLSKYETWTLDWFEEAKRFHILAPGWLRAFKGGR